MRFLHVFMLVSALVLGAGCASSDLDMDAALRERGIREFEKAYIPYVDVTAAAKIIERPTIYSACAAEPAPDMDYYIKKYIEEGYLLVGEVLLDNDKYSLDIVATHCGKVGAEHALFYSQPISAIAPLTTILPQFSFAQATVQGLLGNYTGFSAGKAKRINSKKSSRTDKTYKTWATYWVKANPPIFGAYYGEIPAVGENKSRKIRGAYVYLVVRNSTAFYKNIIAGDIITRLDDYNIYSPRDLTKTISAKAGREVNLHIKRNGQLVRLSLLLNPAYIP